MKLLKKLLGTGHNGRNKQCSFLGKIIWKFEINLWTFNAKQCFSRIIQVTVVTLLIRNGLPKTSSSVNDHKTSLEREFHRQYIFYFHFFFFFKRSFWNFLRVNGYFHGVPRTFWEQFFLKFFTGHPIYSSYKLQPNLVSNLLLNSQSEYWKLTRPYILVCANTTYILPQNYTPWLLSA